MKLIQVFLMLLPMSFWLQLGQAQCGILKYKDCNCPRNYWRPGTSLDIQAGDSHHTCKGGGTCDPHVCTCYLCSSSKCEGNPCNDDIRATRSIGGSGWIQQWKIPETPYSDYFFQEDIGGNHHCLDIRHYLGTTPQGYDVYSTVVIQNGRSALFPQYTFYSTWTTIDGDEHPQVQMQPVKCEVDY